MIACIIFSLANDVVQLQIAGADGTWPIQVLEGSSPAAFKLA
jgi:hypothetical protein